MSVVWDCMIIYLSNHFRMFAGFFNPAILGPKLFGLIEGRQFFCAHVIQIAFIECDECLCDDHFTNTAEIPRYEASRTLTLISKILQNLANLGNLYLLFLAVRALCANMNWFGLGFVCVRAIIIIIISGVWSEGALYGRPQWSYFRKERRNEVLPRFSLRMYRSPLPSLHPQIPCSPHIFLNSRWSSHWTTERMMSQQLTCKKRWPVFIAASKQYCQTYKPNILTYHSPTHKTNIPTD